MLVPQTDASFGFEASGQVTDVYVKVGDQVVVPEGVIDLGVGQPNNAILPIDYIRRAAALELAESSEFLQYGAEWGDGHHRIALAEYLTSAYGVPITMPAAAFSVARHAPTGKPPPMSRIAVVCGKQKCAPRAAVVISVT